VPVDAERFRQMFECPRAESPTESAPTIRQWVKPPLTGPIIYCLFPTSTGAAFNVFDVATEHWIPLPHSVVP
jgi:hypothetical protein